MKGPTKVLTALFGVVMVAGCANQITSDVTRFHTLGAPAGETVMIVPKNEEKLGSLEFRDYAQLIGDRLGSLGYRPAQSGTTPDLLVKVDYEVDEGRTQGYGGYGYGGYGGYGHGYGHFGHHGFGHHGYGGYGYGGYGGYGGRTYTVYTRKLEIDIVRRGSSETIFEGVVDSVGRNKRLNEVMFYLVQAMFDGFPGEHGVTHRVTVEIPKQQASNY